MLGGTGEGGNKLAWLPWGFSKHEKIYVTIIYSYKKILVSRINPSFIEDHFVQHVNITANKSLMK